MPAYNSLSPLDRGTFNIMGTLEDEGFEVEIINRMTDCPIIQRHELVARVEAGMIDPREEIYTESLEVTVIIYYSGETSKLHKLAAFASSTGEQIAELIKPNSDFFLEEMYCLIKQKFRHDV